MLVVGALLGAMLGFGVAAWFICVSEMSLLLLNWTCLQDAPG